jgi:hypothetical protein
MPWSAELRNGTKVILAVPTPMRIDLRRKLGSKFEANKGSPH